MAANILAIPFSTVDLEATFSAENRVIDFNRAALAPETLEMLICVGNWYRKMYWVKKREKVSIQQNYYI